MMSSDPYGAIARKYPLPAEQRFFALEAENKRLREALEPFARAASDKSPDDWGVNSRHELTEGDLRGARSALGVTEH